MRWRVEATVASVEDEFGAIDILVNAVGGSTIIANSGAEVDELTFAEWQRLIAFNLDGTFLFTHTVVPIMKRRRSGKIVNLASIAGTGPAPGLGAYGATKAAVLGLTRTLNVELEDDGIRAIAIAPGFVDTPMAEWSGIEPEEMIKPEDCAEIVRMCLRLSPRARIPQVIVERAGSSVGVG